MRIAVFPGSFDPITKGHIDIASRAIPLFDKIIIAIGKNANKQYMFSLEQRLSWIEEIFKDEPKVVVDSYTGLTTAYCKHQKAQFILRGLRNAADFEFEKAIGQANHKLYPDLETIFMMPSAGYSFISSSIARDVIRNGGDHSLFLPDEVKL
jgi:pantetheine-phosphate adenylyltransferase